MYERLIVGEAPTMPNSSPSKLALWMEYSLADLDKVLFCRGELEYELKGYDFKYILNNWDVSLIPCFPGQLGERVAQTQSYLESPEQVKGFISIIRSDLRYHPKKDEILNSIGVSISEPYYKVVEAMMGEEKLRLYKQAINGRPKK